MTEVEIHDQEKYKEFKEMSPFQLEKHREDNFSGLNEGLISLMHPEFYTAAKSILDVYFYGSLPSSNSMRWKDMSKEDVLNLLVGVYPFSSSGDLNGELIKNRFPGEQTTLYQRLPRFGIEYGQLPFCRLDEEADDEIGETYSADALFIDGVEYPF